LFGTSPGKKAIANAGKALRSLGLKYEERDGGIMLSAMGDDLPIGMAILPDDDNRTLNIYCYLMFDIPPDARKALVLELNSLNSEINNGGFYMDEEGKIFFKIVQSLYDAVPSPATISHLVQVAFKTVDINDGKLKGLIPRDALRKDLMYS